MRIVSFCSSVANEFNLSEASMLWNACINIGNSIGNLALCSSQRTFFSAYGTL